MFIKFCEVSGLKLAELLNFVHGSENMVSTKIGDEKQKKCRVVTCVGIQPQQYDVKTSQKLPETVYTVDVEISESVIPRIRSVMHFQNRVYELVRY